MSRMAKLHVTAAVLVGACFSFLPPATASASSWRTYHYAMHYTGLVRYSYTSDHKSSAYDHNGSTCQRTTNGSASIKFTQSWTMRITAKNAGSTKHPDWQVKADSTKVMHGSGPQTRSERSDDYVHEKGSVQGCFTGTGKPLNGQFNCTAMNFRLIPWLEDQFTWQYLPDETDPQSVDLLALVYEGADTNFTGTDTVPAPFDKKSCSHFDTDAAYDAPALGDGGIATPNINELINAGLGRDFSIFRMGLGPKHAITDQVSWKRHAAQHDPTTQDCAGATASSQWKCTVDAGKSLLDGTFTFTRVS